MIFTPEVQVNDGVNVNNFPATQTVTGTVSVGNFPATQDVNVVNTPTVSVNNFPGSSVTAATVTNISVGTSSLTLAALNSARVKLIVHNEAGTLFVKLGTSASNSSYTYRLTASATLEIGQYAGIVTAVKASGTSAVLVTEL
jgi:hypothetical protein